jgi:hypothetical protein
MKRVQDGFGVGFGDAEEGAGGANEENTNPI